MLYSATCEKCGDVEINKPMAADFPTKHTCGHILRRTYAAPAVHYASGGFYATDVSRMQNMIGPERYARFEAQRDAAQARAKTGTLTPYERQLEHA